MKVTKQDKIGPIDIRKYRELNNNYAFNIEVKKLHEKFHSLLYGPNLKSNYTSIISSKLLINNNLIELKQNIQEILSNSSLIAETNFKECVYYIFHLYSELEYPLELQNILTQDVLFFLNKKSIDKFSLDGEIPKDELTSLNISFEIFKSTYPHKFQREIFYKALDLRISHGRAIAQSYLKKIDSDMQLNCITRSTKIEVIKDKPMIEVSIYDSERELRRIISGNLWRNYIKMLNTKTISQRNCEVIEKDDQIFIFFPKIIDTQDKMRRILPKIMGKIINIQDKIKKRVNPKYNRKRVARNFSLSYRALRLDKRGESFEYILEDNDSITIDYILKKHSFNKKSVI